MLLAQYGQEKQQSANEMSLSLLSCFSCILFENKSEQPIYLIPFLLKSFLRNVFFTWTQTEYLIHSVSNTSVQFQLLNITHRCYHATSTSSNGFFSPGLLIPDSSPMGVEIRHLGLLAHLIDFLPHVLGGGLQCSFTVKWLIFIYSR